MQLIANLQINSQNLTEIISKLKTLYNTKNIEKDRKNYLLELIRKNGYLPYPHVKTLKELSSAETIIVLEEKLKLNGTYSQNGFCIEETMFSPAKRAGFQNASWSTKEQHNIKLTNLAGLGNGNNSQEVGRFIDWIKQLITLPIGKPEEGILATTVYLIPFHPREFGCAYIPKHSGISDILEDKQLKSHLGLQAKDQVRLFTALCQLCGHPVIYDVLPQTGRFSKIVLTNPHVVRWFDIKMLSHQLSAQPENLQEKEMLEIKKKLSNEMMLCQNQRELSKRVKYIINSELNKHESEQLSEEDMSDDQQNQIIGKLIQQGLWPSGGGAWCSAGTPVYDKMSECGGYPTFKHFDYKGNDVTHFANLDCQAPYYFVNLEHGTYNEDVIEFYVNYLKKLQKDYNFDGFRVDHIDHIADKVSEQNSKPISYRAPKLVLNKANEELRKENPHFAALAEYMLWDNLLDEYHKDMSFDLLWGDDIVSQYQKDVSLIIEDNKKLEEYNITGNNLSILKTYNNQDGEFREINQYPGQLGEEGALFKWAKQKLLPGGKHAQRPVLFIDGDESFTKTGIEEVINCEKSMVREDNQEFFDKFNAINKFALNNEIIKNGKARLYHVDKNSGYVSWFVEKEDSAEKLLIVANEKPPIEMTKIVNGQEVNEFTYIENHPIENAYVELPEKTSLNCEYVYNHDTKQFETNNIVENLTDRTLYFTIIMPSEFHIYQLT